ncbi:hypothetical protein G3554_14700 [Micromonospora sp. PPF5-17]|uniref:ATP-dependent DNA helicase RecG n=1 Tax=Micromonospora solifontis TaxID=2487138 RepID=A0ABX9WEY5_9ACTN|nr:hypothetical protein [Micromonospora sp. PPF5-6]NES37405.1 hypothetical protein [Micromonospora solifontis]NES58050.1 hypothetical protein [Micromonospora sp. PPF5-6]RNL98422.1 hypothetical protein EFE23_14740 [Micromonospora solifontis]
MTTLRRLPFAVSVLVTAGAVLFGTAAAAAPPAVPPQLAAHGACDPIDPAACLLPFPNDYFTVPDPVSPTGRRVQIPAASMPANVRGVPIDPTEWNRQDGYSPGTPILVHVPGLDAAATGIAPVTDIGRSLAPDAPIVLLNTATGRRTPYWAELDAHAAGQPDRQLLIIRPAVALAEGTRYVVGLRGLRDRNGALIPAPAAFQAYVNGAGASPRDPRTPQLKRILADLTTAGVKRHDLYLAWDFTVASRQGLTGRMLAIRDDAFAALGAAAPSFAVTQVVNYAPEQDPRIARQVSGTIAVPSYLTGDGGPGSRLHYGPADGDGKAHTPDARPTPSGATLRADFVCNIPRSASAADPAHLSLYGHGLLGRPTEINAGNVKTMSATHNFTFCATSWIGMANADIPYVAGAFTDLSAFPAVADRLQQSFLNFLFLGRAMIHPGGFAAAPAFEDASGQPLIDGPGGLHYDGNSQGGINGGALTAIAQDWTRSVLGVPAMNYSTLLQRSLDFAPFQSIMDQSYPDKADQQLIFALLQMLWDRSEANGYAQHMTDQPLPGTPAHQVLMHVAFGDHQVSPAAAEVEARTIGARLHTPALADGWSLDVKPYWGIAPIPGYPYTGSAIVIWNSGAAAAPPPTNLAPAGAEYGDDPHEFPRAQPTAQEQKATFLLTGAIVDVCAGAPCP